MQALRKLLLRVFGAGRGMDAMLLVARRPALLLARPELMAQSLARLQTLLRLPMHKLMAAILQ